VGGEYLDKEFVEYIRGLKTSPSAFMVLGGGHGSLRLPTIIVVDEELHVVVNSNAGPKVRLASP
jgi:hypothetical protein